MEKVLEKTLPQDIAAAEAPTKQKEDNATLTEKPLKEVTREAQTLNRNELLSSLLTDAIRESGIDGVELTGLSKQAAELLVEFASEGQLNGVSKSELKPKNFPKLVHTTRLSLERELAKVREETERNAIRLHPHVFRAKVMKFPSIGDSLDLRAEIPTSDGKIVERKVNLTYPDGKRPSLELSQETYVCIPGVTTVDQKRIFKLDVIPETAKTSGGLVFGNDAYKRIDAKGGQKRRHHGT